MRKAFNALIGLFYLVVLCVAMFFNKEVSNNVILGLLILVFAHMKKEEN